MELRRSCALAALLLAAAPAPGLAQLADELRGLEVGVLVAGPDPATRDRLEAALRRGLEEALGPTLAPGALGPPALTLDSGVREVALAGRRAGVPYVVAVSLARRDGGLELRALLVDTDTGEVALEARPSLPGAAPDLEEAGEGIARRCLQTLASLRTPEAGLVPVKRAPDRLPGAPKLAKPAPAPVSIEPPPPDRRTVPITGAAARARAEGPEAPDPFAMPGEFLRLTVGYGAGLVRAYGLESPGVGRSSLSYQIDPVSHLSGRIDLRVPGGRLGFTLAGSHRPVTYRVEAIDPGTPSPSGSLTETAFALLWHLPLAPGTRAIRLIPQLGGRLAVGVVEPHAGNAVLSASSFALTAGMAARGRPMDNLELQGLLEAGLILSYSESPRTSGGSPRGFLGAGEFSARLWLTPAFAFALDVRLGVDRVAFGGLPSRVLPALEQGRLRDLELTVTDLRTSFGLAFRL